MGTDTSLPGSSYEELAKIIKGYAHIGDNASLDSLANLIGMNKTAVSRNNKFLAELGIVSGGQKKSPTELGKKLGRALDHNQEEDSRRYWREAIQGSEVFSKLVTTVRIKSGMTSEGLSSHILYVSGQKANGPNKTGANTLVDILCNAGLLINVDGAVSVTTPKEEFPSTGSDEEIHAAQQEAASTVKTSSAPSALEPPNIVQHMPIATSGIPSIAINIQLHLPETDNAEVYEKLFKTLREQLISPQEK